MFSNRSKQKLFLERITRPFGCGCRAAKFPGYGEAVLLRKELIFRHAKRDARNAWRIVQRTAQARIPKTKVHRATLVEPCGHGEMLANVTEPSAQKAVGQLVADEILEGQDLSGLGEVNYDHAPKQGGAAGAIQGQPVVRFRCLAEEYFRSYERPDSLLPAPKSEDGILPFSGQTKDFTGGGFVVLEVHRGRRVGHGSEAAGRKRQQNHSRPEQQEPTDQTNECYGQKA